MRTATCGQSAGDPVRSSHKRHVLRFDFIQDPHFSRLPVRILFKLEIFHCHPVNVFTCTLFRYFGNPAAHFEVTVGIFRITERKRDGSGSGGWEYNLGQAKRC